VGGFAAASGGHIGQGGVFADVLRGLRAYGALGEEHGWPVRVNAQWRCENWLFDHQALPLALQELCLGAGVELLFATSVAGAEMDGSRIDRAVVHNRSLRQQVVAKLFIDATGDGVLARHAGAPVLPDDPNFPGVIKPNFMIYLRKVEGARPQPLPSVRQGADSEELEYSVWQEPDGRVGLKIKLFHMTFDTGDGEGFSRCAMAMRERIARTVRHFQQKHDPSYVFDFASPMLGVREGRRVAGDYVLTIDDCRAGRCFSDAVAYGSFTVDANRTREILPPYQIPYPSPHYSRVLTVCA
jgi:hypothetical protein